MSYGGGRIPDADVVSQADFVLLHGNGQNDARIATMVSQVKAMPAYRAHPKPIVFNEDSPSIANMTAAVTAGASWGYLDVGDNNYRDGFQSAPVDWTIDTLSKHAFFNNAYRLAVGPAGGASTVVQRSLGGGPIPFLAVALGTLALLLFSGALASRSRDRA